MRRAYNSTIRVREKICVRCGKPSYIFSRGRCQQCSKIEDTLAREEKDVEKEDGLPELIKELDALVSRYVRLKNADKAGNIQCYTCPAVKPIAEMQAGHYVPRGNMLLRYDVDRNIRCQCPHCNEYKRGNLTEFGKRLESELPGITETLLEESHIVYRYTREELRSMIKEYTNKIKLLKTIK